MTSPSILESKSPTQEKNPQISHFPLYLIRALPVPLRANGAMQFQDGPDLHRCVKASQCGAVSTVLLEMLEEFCNNRSKR
jgi:hypothetical protein